MNSFLFAASWTLFASPLFANVQVAVTVDDLPTHGALPAHVTRLDIAKQMISVFKKHKISEVYGFINAGKIEQDPQAIEVLKLWIASGHLLGNHTYAHQDINKVSIDEFKKSIDQNEIMLRQVSGSSDWKYFRYPFLREGDSLEKRNAIRKYLKDKNYKTAQVTIDFEDQSLLIRL